MELVQDLARRLGTPVTVEFYPWQRALAMAGVLPHIAVLPVTRTPEREALFRWLVRLHQQNFVFVALRGGVDVRDLTLLRRQRLVVLRGSPHKRVLQELDFVDVAECSTVRECMRMVKKGIADATYGGEDIHRNAAGADGHREAEFDFSPAFRSGEIWLAGSLDFSEEDGRKWRAALEAARADGTLARILRKYGLPATERQRSGNGAATAAGSGGAAWAPTSPAGRGAPGSRRSACVPCRWPFAAAPRACGPARRSRPPRAAAACRDAAGGWCRRSAGTSAG
ncbi:ABC-type amino acid transport periplasmic component [Janthinobacterium sp. HH01]|nr:ABC-type amino acid transport periplasmic component [Janthinobacterium sp. HH01]